MSAMAWAAETTEVIEQTSGAMEVINFLFGSYQGLAILIGGGLLISLLLAYFLERRTRKVYKDRGPGSGSFFFDDDEEEEEQK